MSALLGNRRIQVSDELAVKSVAEFSGCGTYRFSLRRELPVVRHGDPVRPVCWIMLNPSTADVLHNDPTIARCQRFTEQWGYTGYTVVNLFALRATSPKHLRSHPAPIGNPENDEIISIEAGRAIEAGGLVVCAWGAHGAIREREQEVLLRVLEGVPLHALAFTKGGSPRHPLYLRSELCPEPWNPTQPNTQSENDSGTTPASGMDTSNGEVRSRSGDGD